MQSEVLFVARSKAFKMELICRNGLATFDALLYPNLSGKSCNACTKMASFQTFDGAARSVVPGMWRLEFRSGDRTRQRAECLVSAFEDRTFVSERVRGQNKDRSEARFAQEASLIIDEKESDPLAMLRLLPCRHALNALRRNCLFVSCWASHVANIPRRRRHPLHRCAGSAPA